MMPRSFSVSPAIHSDPELLTTTSSNCWWRRRWGDDDDDDDDGAADLNGTEWNTCPEGYDYADAEHSRALLLGTGAEAVRQAAIEKSRRTGHVNVSECLFGLDSDDAHADSSTDSSEDDDDDSDRGGLIDDDDRWNPLKEFM